MRLKVNKRNVQEEKKEIYDKESVLFFLLHRHKQMTSSTLETVFFTTVFAFLSLHTVHATLVWSSTNFVQAMATITFLACVFYSTLMYARHAFPYSRFHLKGCPIDADVDVDESDADVSVNENDADVSVNENDADVYESDVDVDADVNESDADVDADFNVNEIDVAVTM